MGQPSTGSGNSQNPSSNVADVSNVLLAKSPWPTKKAIVAVQKAIGCDLRRHLTVKHGVYYGGGPASIETKAYAAILASTPGEGNHIVELCCGAGGVGIGLKRYAKAVGILAVDQKQGYLELFEQNVHVILRLDEIRMIDQDEDSSTIEVSISQLLEDLQIQRVISS